MKALNFLQMWQLCYAEFTKFCEWLCNFFNRKYTNIGDWAHFLNQPFKPEMIEEYFENFALLEKRHKFDVTKCYLTKNDIILIFVENSDSIDNTKMMIKDNPFFTKEYPRPRTLDEFITLCQLAVIELEWRKK